LESVYITRLKTELAKTGKKTKEVAVELCISPAVLRNARCGYSSPKTREGLAKYLGKTVKYLFGGYV